ncbi:LXG domain-containing protein [Cytobacillus sp. AMY 15.2]|nr:LXG domain-containing protein [Cytobacillus sp. AMY 15.2]
MGSQKVSIQLSNGRRRFILNITSLEESFQGEGAAAIRAFFEECHSPFLLFFEGFLADYQNTLKRKNGFFPSDARAGRQWIHPSELFGWRSGTGSGKNRIYNH